MACRTLILGTAITLALFSLTGCGGGADADSTGSAAGGGGAAEGSPDGAPPATVAEVDE